MGEEIENKYTNKHGLIIYHGYQEWYYFGGLWVRTNYKFDEEIGYDEDHRKKETMFHIK
jgi:hypothetical protein